jgi:hypothetical protein
MNSWVTRHFEAAPCCIADGQKLAERESLSIKFLLQHLQSFERPARGRRGMITELRTSFQCGLTRKWMRQESGLETVRVQVTSKEASGAMMRLKFLEMKRLTSERQMISGRSRLDNFHLRRRPRKGGPVVNWLAKG